MTASATFDELRKEVDTFLLQYKSAKHSATKDASLELLGGLDCAFEHEKFRVHGSYKLSWEDFRLDTKISVRNVGKSMVPALNINDLNLLCGSAD